MAKDESKNTDTFKMLTNELGRFLDIIDMDYDIIGKEKGR